MDIKGLYSRVLEQATEAVDKVRPEELDRALADSEWTVRDVIDRMLRELTQLPDILQGKTVEEVGDKYDSSLLEDEDLQATWHTLADAALRAVASSDLDADVHLFSGATPTSEYLQTAASNLQANLMILTGRRHPSTP